MKPGPELATFAFHEVTDDPRASGFQRPAALPYKHTRLAFAQHLASIGAFFHEVGQACKKEFAGILFLGLYFVALPGVLAKTVMRKLYAQMDFVRSSITVMLFLTMFTLPLKMICRWLFNLKYFIDTPWIKF